MLDKFVAFGSAKCGYLYNGVWRLLSSQDVDISRQKSWMEHIDAIEMLYVLKLPITLVKKSAHRNSHMVASGHRTL